MIPYEVVMKAEQDAIRRRKNEARRNRRNHHTRSIPNRERPFVAWDGEGPRDAGYALFGSNLGDELCHPHLGTTECLDLILSREEKTPEAIHVWFGSNYDVSMILKDLPWRHLSALKHWGSTTWREYDLEHIPTKWFEVRRNGVCAKIFDIRNFFAGTYVQALLDMKIGTEDEISHLTSEKARRSEFLWSEIDEIREYWRLELRLMPELCNALRTTFLDAGFNVRSWHGPGSLANLAMRRHGVFEAMAKTPADVQIAARYGFAGGRFEMFRGGHIQRRIYNADLHSAYPAFARELPNLNSGRWRHTDRYEPGRFGIYYIHYSSGYEPLRPYPLFRRVSGGEVVWPNQCEGWYWRPEAELVANDPDARITEGWVFDEEDVNDKPFMWLEEYYDKRQFLKSIGSPLELTFKLIINSVYGQLAQRTGWDRHNRTAPKSHQLEWAGYITSACRASVYRAARTIGNGLISIDTDGVYGTDQFRNLDFGPHLGQWDSESWDAGIFWQSGIYALQRDGQWKKGKTRGIPKGKYKPEKLLESLEKNEPLKLTKKNFIGYGLALNGQRDMLNTWTEDPVEVVFGGQGKRYHNRDLWCGRIGCLDGSHDFIPRPYRETPRDTIRSEPHFLPWLGNDPLVISKKQLAGDWALFDLNHLGEDEEWVENYDRRSYPGQGIEN